MAHHFTQGTESVTQWCEHCGKLTQHAVSAGRIGRCTEHGPQQYTKAQLRRLQTQERERQAPRMFE
jgi:hypothetical protein